MRVRALKSFAGPLGRHDEGEVFDLPERCDWLQAGLVEPAEDETFFTPKPTSSAVKGGVYEVQERSKGWYDVVGDDGEPVNEKALREDAARDLADEMNA